MAEELPRSKPFGKSSLSATAVRVAFGLVAVAAAIGVVSGHWQSASRVWHRMLGYSVHPSVMQVLLALAIIVVYLAGCRLLYRDPPWIFIEQFPSTRSVESSLTSQRHAPPSSGGR